MVAPNTTESLVRRAKDGDRAAFEALTESCRGRLESTVRSRIGPTIKGRIQVEDILQETYLRAFQSVDRFQLRTATPSTMLSRLVGEVRAVFRRQPIEATEVPRTRLSRSSIPVRKSASSSSTVRFSAVQARTPRSV